MSNEVDNEQNQFQTLVDGLKNHGVSDADIKLFLAYLEENDYDYDTIVEDVSDREQSMIIDFFRDELNNVKLFDILLSILHDESKPKDDATANDIAIKSILQSYQRSMPLSAACMDITTKSIPQFENNNINDDCYEYFCDMEYQPVAMCCSMMDTFDNGIRMDIMQSDEEATIGLSIGGSKDTNNFRQCIEQNIMPSINSITYNGLLYQYFFDTKTRQHNTNKNVIDQSMLFYPSYCYAKVSELVFDEAFKCNDNKKEFYMTVGLDSNIKQNEFKRKHLNLIILVDVSGSMNGWFGDKATFDVDLKGEWRNTLKINDKIDVKDQRDWYNAKVIEVDDKLKKVQINYIGWGDKYNEYIPMNSDRLAPFNSAQTKMYSAKKAIKSVLKQLTLKDRLSIITFDKKSEIIQKLEFINDINMDDLNTKIENMRARGGTNFEVGYKQSTQVYKELFNYNEYKLNSINNDYDNRIIVFTDAQINEGLHDKQQILQLIEKYAENKPQDTDINWKYAENKQAEIGNDTYIRNRIYCTFIGVGLDFNSSLIDSISSTRGCNYYSVESNKEFSDKMDEEFEFMVTPLVFNVCLKLKCEGNLFKIDKVYGAQKNKENDILNTGEITKINTLFPSKKSNKKGGGTKGGIQLIKLKKNEENKDDNINVELEVTFEDRYGKKYVNIQNVTFNPPKEKIDNDMIEIEEKEKEEMNINFYDNNGIRKAILLCKYVELVKKWIGDNKYMSLNASLLMDEKYKNIFTNFIEYFKQEMIECDDNTLQQELDIMNKLINL